MKNGRKTSVACIREVDALKDAHAALARYMVHRFTIEKVSCS